MMKRKKDAVKTCPNCGYCPTCGQTHPTWSGNLINTSGAAVATVSAMRYRNA